MRCKACNALIQDHTKDLIDLEYCLCCLDKLTIISSEKEVKFYCLEDATEGVTKTANPLY